jgi:hypothetical protein
MAPFAEILRGRDQPFSTYAAPAGQGATREYRQDRYRYTRSAYPGGVARVLGVVAVLAIFAAMMAALVWMGRSVRRRGSRLGSAAMGPFEEIWHPAARRARLKTELVEERMVPMPTADDNPGSAAVHGAPPGRERVSRRPSPRR